MLQDIAYNLTSDALAIAIVFGLSLYLTNSFLIIAPETISELESASILCQIGAVASQITVVWHENLQGSFMLGVLVFLLTLTLAHFFTTEAATVSVSAEYAIAKIFAWYVCALSLIIVLAHIDVYLIDQQKPVEASLFRSGMLPIAFLFQTRLDHYYAHIFGHVAKRHPEKAIAYKRNANLGAWLTKAGFFVMGVGILFGLFAKEVFKNYTNVIFYVDFFLFIIEVSIISSLMRNGPWIIFLAKKLKVEHEN